MDAVTYVYRPARAGEPAGWYAVTPDGYELAHESDEAGQESGRVPGLRRAAGPATSPSRESGVRTMRALSKDFRRRSGAAGRAVRRRVSGRYQVEFWTEE